MRLFFTIAFILYILACISPADSQTINADRPGIGIGTDIVPQYYAQAEIGSDSYEIREGILPRTEIMKDNTSFGIKYATIDSDIFKLSSKLSYDVHNGIYMEIPAKYIFNKHFNLGTDVIINKHSQTYVTSYNFNPNDAWTISPIVYYDTKPKSGFYISYIPPKYQNIQLDAGWGQEKAQIGISVIMNLLKK
jgi:hypothetical protein